MRIFHRWRRGLTVLLTVWTAIIVIKYVVTSQSSDDLDPQPRRGPNEDGIHTSPLQPLVTSSQPAASQSLPCDADCQRFRQLLRSWPDDKPRAVIYYLVQSRRIDKLNSSIFLLDQNFNNRYQYPVIVFIEEDLNTDAGRRLIRSFTGSDQSAQSRLFIQVVRFRLPDFLTRPVPKRAGNGKPIGYRHMCRFHAKLVYEEPTMTSQPEIQYAWRLDDDSYLYRPISYDVFVFMRDRQLQYGYIQIRDEAPALTRGLWESADEYIEQSGLERTQFYAEWRHTKIYYTNFELSDMSVWMSAKYRKFIEFIDRRGGIFYRRWGDAPIKSIAVTLFVPRSKTHRFKDLPYKHDIYTNRGRQ